MNHLDSSIKGRTHQPSPRLTHNSYFTHYYIEARTCMTPFAGTLFDSPGFLPVSRASLIYACWCVSLSCNTHHWQRECRKLSSSPSAYITNSDFYPSRPEFIFKKSSSSSTGIEPRTCVNANVAFDHSTDGLNRGLHTQSRLNKGVRIPIETWSSYSDEEAIPLPAMTWDQKCNTCNTRGHFILPCGEVHVRGVNFHKYGDEEGCLTLRCRVRAWHGYK